MAATKTHPSEISPKYQDKIRGHIKALDIVKALQDHILNGLKLTNTQVRSAEVLLRKVSPDLLATAITSDTGTALPVLQIVRSAPHISSDASAGQPSSKVSAIAGPESGQAAPDPAA